MHKVLSGGIVALLATLSSVPAAAQTQPAAPDPNAPPRVLVIFREAVKPGRAASHAATEAGWPAAFTKAQWPVNYLAVTSMTGPSEAWFMTGYPSLDAWEKDSKAVEANAALSAELEKLSAQDAEHINSVTTMVATYVPSLSYRPNGPANLVDKRYLSIETIRIKPGYGREFNEQWRAIVAAHEKANMAESWATYAVQDGAPAGTFLFIYALKSLKDVDDAGPLHGGDAYRDAMGEVGRQKNREMNQIAVDFNQTQLYAFAPKMSYPPKAFIDKDPEYWTPKPAALPATPVRRPAASRPPGQ